MKIFHNKFLIRNKNILSDAYFICNLTPLSPPLLTSNNESNKIKENIIALNFKSKEELFS